MKPSSFSTIATKASSVELFGLLLSIGVHHPNIKVYIMCDTYTKNYIKNATPKPNIRIHWHTELDKYTDLDRASMEKKGIFLEFLMNKMNIMKFALFHVSDTLFLDSDIILLSPITQIDKNKKLGVSKQYLVKESLEETGYYNAGMLWTNTVLVCEDWKKFSKVSRYFEQASIEKLFTKYSSFSFGEECNVQSWRYQFNNEVGVSLESYFNSNKNGSITYKGKELVCIHTHFNHERHKKFNDLIIKHLVIAKRYKELLIISRIIANKWVLQIPVNQHQDSFRELAIMMGEKNDDVDVKRTTGNHCYLVPNIMLYDYPKLEWVDKSVMSASLFLLGNGDVKNEGHMVREKTGVPVLPWIFWPKHPHTLETFLANQPLLKYNQRKTESIFIGTIENNEQYKYRIPFINEWSKTITHFDCVIKGKHKYSQHEYLELLRNSKYGLCIRGYGKKCHREIELMALGTVPIVTDDVNTSSFLEPLIENTHFFKVSSPSELKKIINKTNKETWMKMSKACHEWYMRNIHSSKAWSSMISGILHTNT